MFGTIEGEGYRDQPRLESGHVAASSHSWLKQFVRDLSLLAHIDAGASLLAAVDNRILTLFTTHADEFAALDLGEIRAWWLSSAVPPPDVPFETIPAEAPGDDAPPGHIALSRAR